MNVIKITLTVMLALVFFASLYILKTERFFDGGAANAIVGGILYLINLISGLILWVMITMALNWPNFIVLAPVFLIIGIIILSVSDYSLPVYAAVFGSIILYGLYNLYKLFKVFVLER